MLNAVKKHESSIKFEAVSVSPGHGIDHTAFLAASNGIYQSSDQRASWQSCHWIMRIVKSMIHQKWLNQGLMMII